MLQDKNNVGEYQALAIQLSHSVPPAESSATTTGICAPYHQILVTLESYTMTIQGQFIFKDDLSTWHSYLKLFVSKNMMGSLLFVNCLYFREPGNTFSNMKVSNTNNETLGLLALSQSPAMVNHRGWKSTLSGSTFPGSVLHVPKLV